MKQENELKNEIEKCKKLEEISKKLDTLKKDLEDYRDLRTLMDKTHVMVKKKTISDMMARSGLEGDN